MRFVTKLHHSFIIENVQPNLEHPQVRPQQDIWTAHGQIPFGHPWFNLLFTRTWGVLLEH